MADITSEELAGRIRDLQNNQKVVTPHSLGVSYQILARRLAELDRKVVKKKVELGDGLVIELRVEVMEKPNTSAVHSQAGGINLLDLLMMAEKENGAVITNVEFFGDLLEIVVSKKELPDSQ